MISTTIGRRALALCACVAALAGSACGDDGPPGPTVTLRITEQFGRELISEEREAPLEGHETVLRLLRGYEDIEMRSFGRHVYSIDGRRLRERPELVGWVLTVNGIEADVIPADYPVYPGDVVQWDYRDWESSLSVRATVGAFPETFARGSFGGLFPTTVECADTRSSACRVVRGALRRAGVSPDGEVDPGPRPPDGEVQRARVLVGAWERWRSRPWPHRLDDGPHDSDIFARFDRDADSLRLFDWNARPVAEAGAGTGLVSAMRPTEADLLWLVTGVDAAGVDRAARALGSEELRGAFAAAVTKEGIEKLPLPPAGED